MQSRRSRRPGGRLRVYLGLAPGAGATCALLSEGHRRAERGAGYVGDSTPGQANGNGHDLNVGLWHEVTASG